MDTTRMGREALTGWRRKVAEPLAGGLARRTRLTADEAEGLIGAAFFLISVWYVVKTLVAAVRANRD